MISPAWPLLIAALLILALPARLRSPFFILAVALSGLAMSQLGEGAGPAVNFIGYELVTTQVDRLSLAFGYIFIVITIIGGIFGFHVKDRWEQCFTLLYAGGALGVIFSGNLLSLFIFWELMAWTSLYLVWSRRTPASRSSGMRYLITHLVGGSILLAGILLHITTTGNISFEPMGQSLASYLILAGFALNAAIPPLHFWLPDAYPESSITGGVYLSAFTTKTAVYALVRGFAGWDILIILGAIMAIYGVFYTIIQNDTRRILSYHIVSQVGYMVCGIGIGTTLAVNGTVAHAINNILYKGLLFMATGSLLQATGKSRLSELGGLYRHLPWLLILYMVGAFSIAGIPGFSGFASKPMVISAAELSSPEWVTILLELASVGTFLSLVIKLPYFAWFGKGSAEITTQRLPKGMYIAMGLTAMLCVGIGIFPQLLYGILPFEVDYQPYTAQHILNTLELQVFTLLTAILLLGYLKSGAKITLDVDWLYRRPAPYAYRLFVMLPDRVFAAIERFGLYLADLARMFARNPLHFLTGWAKRLGSTRYRKEEIDSTDSRLSIGVMGTVLLLGFAIIVVLLLV
jgi:multicomponent Na+:H+ antiporter subunit D